MLERGLSISGCRSQSPFLPMQVPGVLASYVTLDQGTGESEILFFLSQGENTDGFVLFDASFKTPIRFTWNYH
jgi:hypothetical protein